MNLNLRQAIIQRVNNKTTEELFEVIEDSVDGDERALPGLGVLFEVIWKNCEQSTQSSLVKTLQEHLQTTEAES